ncbi:MAG: response regulator [Candidatus Woesearchaeota archaeon]
MEEKIPLKDASSNSKENQPDIPTEKYLDIARESSLSIPAYLESLKTKKELKLIIFEDETIVSSLIKERFLEYTHEENITVVNSIEEKSQIPRLNEFDLIISDINLKSRNPNFNGLDIIQMAKNKGIPYVAMSADPSYAGKIDPGHFIKKEGTGIDIEKIIKIYQRSQIETATQKIHQENLASKFIGDNLLLFEGKTDVHDSKEAEKGKIRDYRDLATLYFENPEFSKLSNKTIQNAVIGIAGDVNPNQKYSLDSTIFVLKPYSSLEEIAANAEAFDIGKETGINIVNSFGALLENKNENKYQKIRINDVETHIVPVVHALATPVRYLLIHYKEWLEELKKSEGSENTPVAPQSKKLIEYLKEIVSKHKKDIIAWQRYDHTQDKSRTKCKDINLENMKKKLTHSTENLRNLNNYYIGNLYKLFSGELKDIESASFLTNLDYALNIYHEKITNPGVIVRNMDKSLSNSGVRTGIVNAKLSDILSLLDNKNASTQIRSLAEQTLVHFDISARPAHIFNDIFKFRNNYHLLQLEEDKLIESRFEFAKDCMVNVKKEDISRYFDDLYLMSYYSSMRMFYLIKNVFLEKENSKLLLGRGSSDSCGKNIGELKKEMNYLLTIATEDINKYARFLFGQKKQEIPLKIEEFLRYENTPNEPKKQKDLNEMLMYTTEEDIKKVIYLSNSTRYIYKKFKERLENGL